MSSSGTACLQSQVEERFGAFERAARRTLRAYATVLRLQQRDDARRQDEQAGHEARNLWPDIVVGAAVLSYVPPMYRTP